MPDGGCAWTYPPPDQRWIGCEEAVTTITIIIITTMIATMIAIISSIGDDCSIKRTTMGEHRRLLPRGQLGWRWRWST